MVGGQLLIGYSEEASTGQLIRDSLARTQRRQTDKPAQSCGAVASLSCDDDTALSARKPETFAVDFFGHTLSLDQVGLPLFTLAMGLLDGFNPCSMWVLMLMISLLAPLE